VTTGDLEALAAAADVALKMVGEWLMTGGVVLVIIVTLPLTIESDRATWATDGDDGDKQEKGRPKSNVDQNRQARDAIREFERETGKKLSRDQIRQAHEEFGRHENPDFHHLVDILRDTFSD
jgi:hypothetical protein